MAKTENKEVAELKTGGALAQVPEYLRDKGSAVMPGIEASDLILPRIKLLQSISSEVEAFDEAQPGVFWHNVLGIPLGSQIDFIIASFRKKYILFAPLGDSRKILARAEDGVNWSPPNEKFEVKIKRVAEKQVWETKPTVKASGLDLFGSSVKGDPNSPPASVLIYEYLVYLPDYPQYSPMLLSLARSQIKPGKDLNSKISFRGIPMQGGRYTATVTEQVGDEGPFKNYLFTSNGFATEAEFEIVSKMAADFGDYKVADEEGIAAETAVDGAAAGDATRQDI